MINAEVLLRGVIGESLLTVSGKPNTVLSVSDGEALIATSRAPHGRPVPVAWVQDALNRVATGETILTEETSGGYRSAFLRAVLAAVPQIVREGLGGLKPLGHRDRDEIRKNIDEQVLGGAPIYFRSTAAEASGGDRLSVRGALTMHGQTRPASFELSAGPDGRLSGTAQLVQSEWGIKPYRGLMGALRCATRSRSSSRAAWRPADQSSREAVTAPQRL